METPGPGARFPPVPGFLAPDLCLREVPGEVEDDVGGPGRPVEHLDPAGCRAGAEPHRGAVRQGRARRPVEARRVGLGASAGKTVRNPAAAVLVTARLKVAAEAPAGTSVCWDAGGPMGPATTMVRSPGAAGPGVVDVEGVGRRSLGEPGVGDTGRCQAAERAPEGLEGDDHPAVARLHPGLEERSRPEPAPTASAVAGSKADAAAAEHAAAHPPGGKEGVDPGGQAGVLWWLRERPARR